MHVIRERRNSDDLGRQSDRAVRDYVRAGLCRVQESVRLRPELQWRSQRLDNAGRMDPAPALPLGPVSISPNRGSGLTQTFSAAFSDPSGGTDIQVVYLDFGSSVFASYSCIVAYVQSNSTLYLVNDTNSSFLGPITAGSSTLLNSQCTISGSGGSSTVSGNTLNVPVAVTFSSVFGGQKNVYGLAQNYSGSQGNGWQIVGSWTPAQAPALGAVSISPTGGSASAQTFRALFTDPNGVSDLQVVYLDFGTSIFAANSCIVAYVSYGNGLYLFNDASNGLVSGSITAGGSGALSNSQCTISGAGGSVLMDGDDLTVPVAITFAGGFTGAKNIYGLAQNYEGANGGWQMLGGWNPGGGSAASTNPVREYIRMGGRVVAIETHSQQ